MGLFNKIAKINPSNYRIFLLTNFVTPFCINILIFMSFYCNIMERIRVRGK